MEEAEPGRAAGRRTTATTTTEGLPDWWESNLAFTDPQDADTDDDGVSDYDEIVNGTDPLAADAHQGDCNP